MLYIKTCMFVYEFWNKMVLQEERIYW